VKTVNISYPRCRQQSKPEAATGWRKSWRMGARRLAVSVKPCSSAASEASHSGDMVKSLVLTYESEQSQALAHVSTSKSWSCR